jgi:hypothetical protein
MKSLKAVVRFSVTGRESCHFRAGYGVVESREATRAGSGRRLY